MNKKTALVVGTVLAATLALGNIPASAGENEKGKGKGKSPAVAAPANDSFGGNSQITEVPFSSSVDLSGASLEADEPQPSCFAAEATVWYSVTSGSEQRFVTKAAAEFDNSVAVYSGAGLTELSEVACAAEGVETELMFPASPGTLYFLQVSAMAKDAGVLSFDLEVDKWESEMLTKNEIPVSIPAIDQAKIVIDGKARASDPKIYDLTVKANETTVGPYGITTPLPLPKIHQELVNLPAQEVMLEISSSYRYDKSQTDCRLYDGDDCMVGLPVSADPSWYTADGSEAELIVSIRVTSNGRVLAERTVAVPFAGQLGGLLP